MILMRNMKKYLQIIPPMHVREYVVFVMSVHSFVSFLVHSFIRPSVNFVKVLCYPSELQISMHNT